MLGRGAQKTFKTATFFTCTSAPGGVAAPKILPRPGGRGCAKNPADRKFTLSSRFAFHWTSLQKIGLSKRMEVLELVSWNWQSCLGSSIIQVRLLIFFANGEYELDWTRHRLKSRFAKGSAIMISFRGPDTQKKYWEDRRLPYKIEYLMRFYGTRAINQRHTVSSPVITKRWGPS